MDSRPQENLFEALLNTAEKVGALSKTIDLLLKIKESSTEQTGCL